MIDIEYKCPFCRAVNRVPARLVTQPSTCRFCMKPVFLTLQTERKPDKQPEMSAHEVAAEAVKAIESGKYALLAINFANGDMVGHTGDITATVNACETADKCVGEIVDHVLAKNGAVVITSDHGNAEEVKNLETGDIDKEHSNNPVPLYIISHDLMGQAGPSGDPPEGDLSLIQPVGMLSDVAPTVLKLLGLEQPPEMTGRSLI